MRAGLIALLLLTGCDTAATRRGYVVGCPQACTEVGMTFWGASINPDSDRPFCLCKTKPDGGA